MHPVPKPQREDKPTLSQWNSTIKRRLVPQVRRAVRNSEHRGGIIHREGKSDSKRWARAATLRLHYERQERFRVGVLALYGEGCLYPLADGTLCGQPGEAHHCHYGGRRRIIGRTAYWQPFNGTVLCCWHHRGGVESVHGTKADKRWRARWERFSDIAFEEGPEAALAWNWTTKR